MSGTCPTLDSLIELGFERVADAVTETVRYKFENLQLDASAVWWWGEEKVMLSGLGHYKGNHLVIDPGDMWSAKVIPNNLGTASEAAAWISFMLQTWREELGSLPDWFIEGERNWDLVPPAREQLAAQERQRAYEAAPKCVIDRDYARPLRRNLMEEISRLEEGEAAEMTFSFDGRALVVDFHGRVHEVIASGEGWPSSYRALVTVKSSFPARFESPWVEVSVYEGYICVNRLRLGPCEAVA